MDHCTVKIKKNVLSNYYDYHRSQVVRWSRLFVHPNNRFQKRSYFLIMNDVFLNLGCLYTKTSDHCARDTKEKRFKLMFWMFPSTCAVVWEVLNETTNFSDPICPSHLLWGLFFLKCYTTEQVQRTIFHVDTKTLRLYTWIVIKKLSNIENVSLSFNNYF